MISIDNNLKSCREDADVYTYSFTKAEVDEINKALQKKAWIDEVKELIKEQNNDNKRIS